MSRLEVFFDYICPYCLRGHEHLLAVLPEFPDVEVEWHPCESHPRPERFGPHSDLCIRGMFYAADHGVPLEDYHQRMYHAIHRDRLDIESIEVVAGIAGGLVDASSLAHALRKGEYIEELAAANRYAFEQSGVWAVPSYRMNDKKLDAVEDVGISREQLRRFLADARC